MSFYTDDFYGNSQTQQSQSQSQAPEDTFVCATCGATTSYLDDATGYLCCTECNTQSQHIAMTEDAMDVGDVQALAATAGNGRYHMAKRARVGDGRRKGRGKLPLDVLDKSKPLPNLVTCLHGIQRILQEGILCLGAILELNDAQVKTITNTIHTLWKSYLQSWKDGATYYGKLHPEVRFSLRDAFITKQHRNLLMKSLVHRAEEALRRKEEQQEKKDTAEGETENEEDQQHKPARRLRRAPLKIDSDSSSGSDSSSSSSDSDSNSNSDSEDDDDERERKNAVSPIQNEDDERLQASLTQQERQQDSVVRAYQKQYSKIDTILKMYSNRKKGRKEAALRLKPDMHFCVSMLWIGVTPLGVTIHDMMQWIANGSLPLLNAFDTMLTDAEQEILEPLAFVYRLPNIPRAYVIEGQARLIVTACRLKSEKYLDSLQLDDESESSDGGVTRSGATTVIHNDEKEESATKRMRPPSQSQSAQEKKEKDPKDAKKKRMPKTVIQFLPSSSVPLLMARYVRALGFGQNILNACLALAGILEHREQGAGPDAPTRATKNAWLPSAIESAHPSKLKTPAHVLAVIVVACKMCAGWEDWAFCRQQPGNVSKIGKKKKRRSNSNDSSIQYASSPSPSSSNTDVKRIKKRRRLLNSPERFIPWNEQQFRLLNNGPMLHEYLEFIEDIYAVDKSDILPRFQDFLSSLDNGASDDEESDNDDEEDNDTTQKESVICWNNVIAGGRNPNRPKLWKHKKRQDWNLHLRKKAAEWTEANGIGKYVLYTNRRSHARMDVLGDNSYQGSLWTPEAFHPHYGNFLEYLAFTTGNDPSEIHAIVAKLDEEVAGTVKAKPAIRQRIYKKKRWVPKEKSSAKESAGLIEFSGENGIEEKGEFLDDEEDLGEEDLGNKDATSEDAEATDEAKSAMVGVLMLESLHVPATKYA